MYKILVFLLLALAGFSSTAAWAQDSGDSATRSPSVSGIQPITGAFGLLLGERFEPDMVASIVAEEQRTYLGKDKMKMTGTLFRFVPHHPDKHFQNYSLITTTDGLIYALQGEYQYDVEMAKGKKAGKVKKERTVRKNCKNAVKALAKELEILYGEPRGKGWDGEWFSFRQKSDTSDKSLRLYANQCRTGKYSIVYTDENISE